MEDKDFIGMFCCPICKEPMSILMDKRLKKIVVTEKGLESHKKVIERLNEIDGELISPKLLIFYSCANIFVI